MVKQMKLIGKAKTVIKSTKATQIIILYKHMMLIFKAEYKFNVYIAKESGNGPYKFTVVRMQQ